MRCGVRLALAGVTLAAGVFGLVVGTAGQARAVETVSAAHGAAWYDVAACRDFTAWSRHHSGARFRRMVRDSESADTYLQVDVGGWAFAVARHDPGSVLREWAGYVWLDCTTSGD